MDEHDPKATRQGNDQQPKQRPTKPESKAVPQQRDSGDAETQGSEAGQASGDISEKTEFISYPTDKIVGIIDDPADLEAALRDLTAAGFTTDDIEVLTGEEGAHRIDVEGDKHGVFACIVRSIQKLGNYESAHLKRHEQELLAGHFGVGVTAKKEEDREKVREILKSHNGHFINFYGTWAMQKLEA
jgi:hypothetical protein